jgi:hypothetical protein
MNDTTYAGAGTPGSDGQWQQAYNNAAERLFGKTEGDTLTDDEDAECIAAADREMEA